MAFQKLKSTAFILDDKWSLQVAEKSRLNDIALATRMLPLGGARHLGILGSGTHDAPEYVNLTLDGSVLAGFTVQARIEVKTEDAGTTVQPQIFDVTASTVHVAGTPTTSLVWEEQLLTLTLPGASRQFRLQVVKSNGNAVVYAIGLIEVKSP